VLRGLHQIKQYQHVIQQQERTSIIRNADPETAPGVEVTSPNPQAPHKPASGCPSARSRKPRPDLRPHFRLAPSIDVTG